MKVRVLYFAGARDMVKMRDELLDLEEGSTLNALSARIFKLHPSLRRLAPSLRFSLNLELVGDGTVLSESDEVGVLPPVAGG